MYTIVEIGQMSPGPPIVPVSAQFEPSRQSPIPM